MDIKQNIQHYFDHFHTHPDMRFNHDALEIGAEILAATVKKS